MATITALLLVSFLVSGCSVLGCRIGCKSCGALSNICFECNDGYLENNGKCERCPDNCEQCSYNKYCSKCKATFWGTGVCGKQCPESCDDSGCEDETGQCYRCQPGFYGRSCLQNCTLCKDGLCDSNNGQCIDGCINGYYEHTVNKVETCRQCSKNCALCQSLGVCLYCDNGFYKLSYKPNNNDPATVCYACQPECEDCDRVENCTVCKSGSYGPLCRSKCTDSNCHRCNDVDNGENCTECVTGHKLNGTSCVPEIKCSQNCYDYCDENGICVGECKDGWSGKMCTKKCANTCQKCQQDNETVCTKCKYGFFTSSCDIPCNEHCSILSNNETCRLLDGYCIDGCTDGYWGDVCNKSCYEGCISTRCSQTDAECETCNRKNYGAACEHTCNEHCVDNTRSTFICRKSDGKCVFGCETGYEGDKCEVAMSTQNPGTINYHNGCTDGQWGDTCNNTCNKGCNSTRCSQTDGYCESCQRNYYGPTCQGECNELCVDDGSMLQICRKSDGRCVVGCIDGYNGDTCEYADSKLSPHGVSETKVYLLGLVTGVGICLIATAGIGLFCYLRKKRKFKSEGNTALQNKDQGGEYENTAVGMKVMSSLETDHHNENQGDEQTQLEAVSNVYEKLQDNNRDGEQHYSELDRPKR